MAMVYDLPTVDASPQPSQQYAAPESKNYNAEQTHEMGNAVTKAGAAVLSIAQDMQNTVDTAAAKEMDNKLADVIRTTLTNNENGYLKTAGKAAVDGRAAVEKALKDAVKGIEEGSQNEVQAFLFKKAAAARVQTAMGQVGMHSLEQAKVYEAAVTKARSDGFRLDAVTSFASWREAGGLYARNKAGMLNEIDQFMAKNGIGKDDPIYKASVMDNTTKLHFDTMKLMLSMEKTQDAKDYYQANTQEISADKRDDFKSMLKQGSLKDDSLRLSMTIGGATYEDQVKNLDKQFADGKISAELRDATLSRLDKNHEIKKTAEADLKIKTMDDAERWLVDNPTKTITDMPPDMLEGVKRAGVFAQINSFAKNGRYTNEPQVVAEILTMKPEQLARYTPKSFEAKYRGQLDEPTMERMLTMVYAARNKEGKEPKVVKGMQFFTENEVVNRAAVEFGIIPNDGKKPVGDNAVKLTNFEREVQRQVRVFEATTLQGKRAASIDELQVIVDRIGKDKVYVDVVGFDPQIPSIAVNQKDLGKTYVTVGSKKEKVYLNSIPPGQRAEIGAALRRQGVPITQQAIADLWVRGGRKR